MATRVALQMDPPQDINVEKDSTFVLGLEAQKRGHTLFYYNAETLSIKNGQISALAAPLQFFRKKNAYFNLGTFKRTALNDFDLILMRQDFNGPLSYAATAHMLDNTDTLILNDPSGVRESPEKLLITQYPDLAPPTLISRNLDQITEFLNEYKDIIIKPLNGFGGKDVYHLKLGDDNLKTVHEMFSRLHPEPFIIQKFIPEIKRGDKRIIVVEGEPVGALLRVPASGTIRGNLAVGGTAAKAEITARDREICERLKPELIKRGLVFVGLDVIGDYVTEINPKSPTGLQHIFRLDGSKCEEAIWDAYEARLAAHKKAKAA